MGFYHYKNGPAFKFILVLYCFDRIPNQVIDKEIYFSSFCRLESPMLNCHSLATSLVLCNPMVKCERKIEQGRRGGACFFNNPLKITYSLNDDTNS